MGPIGEWVLRMACGHLKRWCTEYGLDLWVAVNLSCRQFADPDLATIVASILRETSLEPSRLQLEIAGNTLSQTPDGSRILGELKRMGLRLALDNFGAGYSSLTDIQGVPFDSIKIDRSLIQTLAEDPACGVIVAAAIAVAHQYGLTVVAEGIEKETQLAALKALRNTDLRPLICDQVQGYLFGRPVPPSEIAEVLRKNITAFDDTTGGAAEGA
jgi:EAL domain-containing protein (putative c-di-GMP-specific phosphodiesterase class I)